MKILFMTKNWIGDILFEFPAIEAIKKHYPDSTVACLAPSRCREILENHPDIDDVILFDERNEHKSLFAKIRLILKLRKEAWDQVYIFHRSRTRAFMMFLGGVKERIGFGGRRRLFLTKVVEEPEPIYHQVDHFMKMLEGIGLSYEPNPPYQFYYKQQDVLGARKLIEENSIEKFACFHLGANWEPKRWPPQNFAALADLLYEKYKLPIVVTGASRDQVLYDAMVPHVKKAKIICLVGKTGLGEAGALFQKACFLVSGDSGPIHIASGVGTPVVALFGPTNPDQTGPRGIGEIEMVKFVPAGYQAPWYGHDLPKEGWLAQIKPDQVFAAICKRGWAEKRPIPPQRKLRSETKTLNAQAQRILLVTLTNIGDVIVTTPVLMSLRAKYPKAHITVVAGPKVQNLLEGSRNIDRLVIYNKKADLFEKLRFLQSLRDQKYDKVIDLRNSMIPFLVGTKKRSPIIGRPKVKNVRKRHLGILEKMRETVSEIPKFDFFHPEDKMTLENKLRSEGVLAQKDWIAIAPAAASGLKTWRLEGFREVIESLLKTRSEEILLVGDQREEALVEPLVSLDPKRIHNLAGKTTLREAACLVSNAALLLTNDSAIMHLGFELNRPVVAIFGPTSAERYGQQGAHFRIVFEKVPCLPCEKPRCSQTRQYCFEDLKSEKVLSACEELLNENIVSC